MVESERELLVTRDSPESRDCTCDEQWPEASDGACPQHGLDSILAATNGRRTHEPRNAS